MSLAIQQVPDCPNGAVLDSRPARVLAGDDGHPARAPADSQIREGLKLSRGRR